MRIGVGLLLMGLTATGARAQAGRLVVDREPNDAVGRAQLVALGDTLKGAIDPSRDLDYYAFSVPAGTIVRLDRSGSYGTPTFSRIELNLIDADGQTSLIWLLEESDQMVLEYAIPTAGRYYLLVRVWDHDDPDESSVPTPQWRYRIALSGAEGNAMRGQDVSAALIAEAVLNPLVARELAPGVIAILDANKNGVLDAGDLHALLRARPE